VRVWCETGVTINKLSSRPKNFRINPKQAGKKWRGSGGGNFLPAYQSAKGGHRVGAAISAKRKMQNRKIFFPFIKRKKFGAEIKM